MEVIVAEDGSLSLPAVPFAPGAKLRLTLEESEPMDAEAFDEALKRHYRQP